MSQTQPPPHLRKMTPSNPTTTTTNSDPHKETTPTHHNASRTNNNNKPNPPPFWELDKAQVTTLYLSEWLSNNSNHNNSNQALSNLLTALDAFQEITHRTPNHNNNNHNNDNIEEPVIRDDEPATKKAKIRMDDSTTIQIWADPYGIWTPIEHSYHNTKLWVLKWDSTQHDPIPTTFGGLLQSLTREGLYRALSHHHATTTTTETSLNHHHNNNMDDSYWRTLAHQLATRIQQQTKYDLQRTTPWRIQNLLAPDCLHFHEVCKRVQEVSTTNNNNNTTTRGSNNNTAAVLPTASALPVHDIEKHKKCKICGNNEQSEFLLDRKNGDVICTVCGTVVSESLMHEGSAYRRFEGEEDRNHHGDAFNPLFSTAHNLGTSLSTTTTTTSGGGGTSGVSSKMAHILRNAHAYTELNLSQFGKKDKRTREGYKDQQKREAFRQMQHASDTLRLHDAVVQRAKVFFANFRDDRELVQQFNAVIAACLTLAFQELSQEGKFTTKEEEQQYQQERKAQQDLITSQNARARRRNDLHHANLAGKGGLLLDFENNDNQNLNTTATTKAASRNEKAVSSWDMEDCRAWLLAASRKIAKDWVELRDSSNPTPQTNEMRKKIPAGRVDELEGILVEHAFNLCEQLETEFSQNTLHHSNTEKKPVVTPRADMTKLGIKWQHSSERGSAGVGDSISNGNSKAGRKTPGQILMLKSAKKMGSFLKDQLVADAFHKELRSVIARQETLKTKLLREEASKNRLQQMKRKPWLQARAQG